MYFHTFVLKVRKYKSCTRTRTVCIQYSYNPSKVTIDTNLRKYLWRRTKVRMKVRTCTCTRVLPDGNRISIGYITLYEGIFRTSVFRTEYVRSCVLRWGSTTTDRRALFISYTTCSCTCTCTVHVIHSTRDTQYTCTCRATCTSFIVHVPELYNVYSCTHTRTCTVQLYTYGAFNASLYYR